jgi:long-chain acyl-CoA synthetase
MSSSVVVKDPWADFYSKRPWLKFYNPDVPADVSIPEAPLYSLLDNTVAKHPNRDALIFLGRKVKYKEEHDASLRFASWLVGMGIGKGDVVAIYLPNSPQFAIAFFGALYAGAAVTPVNPLYTARELRFQLENSEAKVLVTLDMFKGTVLEGVPDSVKYVVWTGMQDYLPPVLIPLYKLRFRPPKVPEGGKHFKFKDVLKKSEPLKNKAKIDPKEDVAALMYTGGTTGIPKGAMLTHYNLVANVHQIYPITVSRTKKECCYMSAVVLPWFHIYGLTCTLLLGTLTASTGIVYPRPPDIETLMRDIEKYKVEVFAGVPVLFMAIVNHPKAKKYNLSSLKTCISGAAPLPVATIEAFEKIAPGALREGYGLTETSPVTHVNHDKYKAGSIGIPIPSTMAAIVDLEKPEFLPPGKIGELVISGPQVMKGYYKMPEENKLVFFEAYGRMWVRTGDIAYVDDDGYFYIVDRKKELIKYKGWSIYPREVEEILYKHECVKMAAVVGKPDPEVGEIPKAFIVLRDECRGRVKHEDIIEWCRKHLAAHKVPREIEFRDELPISAAGKVLRRVLKEEEMKKAGLAK